MSNFTNFASSTLASEISDSATTLDVAIGDGEKFPDEDFNVAIGTEIIHVGVRSGDTFSSLTRGYDGTTSSIHGSGAVVQLRVIAADLELGLAGVLGLRNLPTPIAARAQSTIGFALGETSKKTVENDVIYFTPVAVAERITLKSVGIRCQTAGSADGTTNLAIYKRLSDGNLAPSPLASFGAVDMTTTGEKWITCDLALKPGIYYMACLPSGYTTTPELYAHGDNNMSVVPINVAYRYGRSGLRSTAGATFDSYTIHYDPTEGIYFYFKLA